MAIAKDHDDMYSMVKRFMVKTDRMKYNYTQTLSYQLIATRLDLKADVRQALREERGGNHIGLHKGELPKSVEGEEWEKRQGKPATLGKGKKAKKRKLDNFADEYLGISSFIKQQEGQKEKESRESRESPL